jgi:uncharacterized RDD family membrane protein YckC
VSQLVTGEAVALDLREAALPSRMVAALIDGVVQGVLLTLLLLVFTFAGFSNQAAAASAVIFIIVSVGLLYTVVLETLWKGKTLGKAALGLRVVRDDAGPIGFRQAFVRGLVGFIVERPGFTLYSAGVISTLVSTRGKRLGDLLAGTVVIQERVVGTHAFQAVMPPPLATWATTLDLSRLPDELANSVRSFLSRAGQMNDRSRAELGNRLASAVGSVTTPPPPPGTPGWAYLTAVLAERRNRAEQLAGVPQSALAWGQQPQYPPPAYTAPPPAPAPVVATPPPPPPPNDGGFHLPG